MNSVFVSELQRWPRVSRSKGTNDGSFLCHVGSLRTPFRFRDVNIHGLRCFSHVNRHFMFKDLMDTGERVRRGGHTFRPASRELSVVGRLVGNSEGYNRVSYRSVQDKITCRCGVSTYTVCGLHYHMVVKNGREGFLTSLLRFRRAINDCFTYVA